MSIPWRCCSAPSMRSQPSEPVVKGFVSHAICTIAQSVEDSGIVSRDVDTTKPFFVQVYNAILTLASQSATTIIATILSVKMQFSRPAHPIDTAQNTSNRTTPDSYNRSNPQPTDPTLAPNHEYPHQFQWRWPGLQPAAP